MLIHYLYMKLNLIDRKIFVATFRAKQQHLLRTILYLDLSAIFVLMVIIAPLGYYKIQQGRSYSQHNFSMLLGNHLCGESNILNNLDPQ